MSRRRLKIIYLFQNILDRRDYERFGIQFFVDRGHRVAIYDLTCLLKPHAYKQITTADPLVYSNLFEFTTWHDFFHALGKDKGKCFLISFITYDPKKLSYWKIYRWISTNRIPYCVFSAIYSIDDDVSKQENQARNSRSLLGGCKTFLRNIYRRVPIAAFGITPAQVMLVGGERSLRKEHFPVNKRTEILWGHTLDYDVYMRSQGKSTSYHRAVFVDQYIPFHPDFVYQKESSPVTSEQYYRSLVRFFCSLEREYGFEIVIAAHPRANYGNKQPFFGDREIIRGNTAELIKNTKLCLMHCSTAINFAVLYRKPILFLTTNELKKSRYQKYIEANASYFGKQPLNTDEKCRIELKKELEVDEETYDKFIREYIKMPHSPKKPLWDLLCSRIEACCCD